ncbi:MAG: FHA domain-containing protein [Deltaproteobacteria bacterium]|nr:FHA domain-containing protein [Deltaproteobacteria bacterium]
MPFQVVVHAFQQLTRSAPLKTGQNLVGRTARADVVLTGPLVSRVHAKLVVEPDGRGVVVHDLDSNNGTFVNGEKVRTRPLTAGDTVYVGGFKLVLESAETRPEEAIDQSLEQLRVSDLTLGALDAARRGEAVAFRGKDPAARQLALMARASDLLTRPGHAQVQDLLRLIRDVTDGDLVALLTAAPGGLMALTTLLGEPTGEPPLCWPAFRRAVEERSAFYSRSKPVDPVLVSSQGFQQPMALLVVPLLKDPESPALGVVQVLRPWTDGGFPDGEVDSALALAHQMAVRLAEGGAEPHAEIPEEVTSPTRTAVEQPAAGGGGGGLSADAVRGALARAVPDELAERVLAAAQGGRMESQVSSGHQVVAFYDVHGFEQAAAGWSTADTARVVGALNAAASDVAGALGGRLDHAMGAGGFLRFWEGSPAEAAEAAVRALLELRSRLPAIPGPDGAALRLRAGVDAGAVVAGVFTQGERATYTLVGAPARLAERITELAGAGEVCVTAAVREGLVQRAGWRLIALGPHAIRGRTEAVDIYRVDGAPAEA